MEHSDIIVIGGGIAGLSAAAKIAEAARVCLLEREPQIGYHASGRSATIYHNGMSTHVVRALSACSFDFFINPPDGFSDIPLAKPCPALFIVRPEKLEELRAFIEEMRFVTDNARMVMAAEMAEMVPVLRTDDAHFSEGILDADAHRLDSDAMLQSFARLLRKRSGRLETGVKIDAIAREGNRWTVRAGERAFSAPILINAAGAWGDEVARQAGIAPIGLQPMRRTIISFDQPAGVEIDAWPFVRSLEDEFYFLPDAGRLLASPADETPSEPCDAQPDEYDVALAAYRIEEATTMSVPRIRSKWAGLRTFAPDRQPVVGFDAAVEGFFWLVGQGGFGLQTSHAVSEVATSLVLGRAWPSDLARFGVSARDLSPARLGG
jgi:D-arginine dehydrogenase